MVGSFYCRLMINPPSQNRLVLLGWFFSLISLVFASVVATGSELTRLALIIPPLFLGAILCVAFGPKRRDVWVLLGVGLVSGYLLLRGGVSPVWDLARRDLFLIVAGLLGYLSASSALRLKSGRAMFLGSIVLLILGNTWVAIYQWRVDESFAFLRRVRVDVLGVSGFYFHRNYLAGFLEIGCPLLLAACLSRKVNVGRLGLLLSLGVGVFICFLTNSRGGFGAMAVACIVVGFIRFMQSKRKVEQSNKRFIGQVTFAIVGILLAVACSRTLWSVIVDNRGGGVSAEGTLQVRLVLAGLAYDIWEKNPIWGMGAESFSYLFPKYFEGLRGRIGNAQMAHSEYLQLLTDYGIVGLVAVGGLVGILSFLIVRPPQMVTGEVRGSQEGGLWLRSAAAGVMVGEVLRATIDFNLHVAPNLMVFAMVLAGGVGCNAQASHKEPSSRATHLKSYWTSYIVALFLVLGIGGYGIRSGSQEIFAARDWAAIEYLRQQGINDEVELRRYSEKAPSFRVLKQVAQTSLTRTLSKPSSDFTQTADDWRRVLERHPLDGESLANYARCLDELGKFKRAEGYHERALEAVARRERLYGVIYGVGGHFLKRGSQAAKERRPEEALFLFQKAREAFKESRRRGFSKDKHSISAMQWINERIGFLEGARIEPKPVEILDWRSKLL